LFGESNEIFGQRFKKKVLKRLRYEKENFFSWTLPTTLQKIRGKLSVCYYNVIYPNFHIGKNYEIWGKFYVTMFSPRTSEIWVGNRSHIVSEAKRGGLSLFSRCKLTVYADGIIQIGERVGLNGTVISSRKKIVIGDNTMIAANVIIADSDFHQQWPPEERWVNPGFEFDQEVYIGKNVWIGMNCIILKGVSIGDNSIIGAGSVVTKDIPSNVIAAGNPAVVIKALGPDCVS
jgi:acetyltransferase-like isoleucine patch superfamily enzyme